MNKRKQQSLKMLETKGYFKQIAYDKFEIKSQSDPNKFYIVNRTGRGFGSTIQII